MISPITTNPTNTIGLCDGTIPKSGYIGKFDLSLLKEWITEVEHNLGNRQVYLYSHKSENPATSAKVLAASIDYNDDMFVCVVGCEDKEDIKEG
jgi:hypothetical protein